MHYARKGVITGYTVNVNWESLGYSTVVYLSIVISEGYDRGKLMTDLAGARGVEEVTLVTNVPGVEAGGGVRAG